MANSPAGAGASFYFLFIVLLACLNLLVVVFVPLRETKGAELSY